MKTIDHIGVALPDFGAAAKIFELLGLQRHDPEEIAEQEVETLSFQVGDSEIELLKPTSPDSPIAKFLDKKGAGIHHFALRVEDIEREIAHLKAEGIRMIDEQPRRGAGGKRIAFIHPKSTGGILIELTEVNEC